MIKSLPLLIPIYLPVTFFYAVALIIGITMQFQAYSYYAMTAALVMLCISLSFYKGTRVSIATGLLIFFFLLGSFLYRKQQEDFLHFQSLYGNKKCTIRGYVYDIEEANNNSFKQIITIAVKEIQPPTHQWNGCSTYIKLYCKYPTDLTINDHVELDALKIPEYRNTRFADFLIKEHIAATIFVTSAHYQVIDHAHASFSTSITTIRNRILKSCKIKISDDSTGALFEILFLGHKPSEKQHIELYKSHFKQWGISHYLARSGLHLVIFLLLMQFFFRYIPLHFVIKQLFLLILILIYALLSWSSVSFFRSEMMITLFILCNMLSIPVNTIHILSLVTMTTLVLNPIQLFFLDFQLSFALTCALALIHQFLVQHSLVKNSKN